MPYPRPLLAVSLIASVALLACSDSTEPVLPPVASIAVTGLPDTVGVGDTLQATAYARDASGAPLGAVTVRWRALDSTIATVDASGRVVVRDVGIARLVASARGRTTVGDTVVVRALLLPSRIHIAGLSTTLFLGGFPGISSDTASAEVRDGRGGALAEPVRWSTSDGWVLAVDSVKGVVVARAAGTAWVRARAGRVRDSVRIDVPVVPLMPGRAWLQVAGTTLSASYATCALETTGQVWCEGAGGTPQPVPGATRLRELHGGQAQYCGLDARGAVHCFGRDGARSFGVYGPSRPLSSDSLYPGGNGLRFLRYDLGDHQAACGIQAADSVVYCWGHNDTGQVGRFPVTGADSVVAPVAGNLRATQLDLTGFSGCAMALDQSVWCWGESNYFGGLRLDTVEPQQVQPPGRYASIATGDLAVCGLSPEGAVSCWGPWVCSEPPAGLESCWGYFAGKGTPASSPIPLAGTLRFERIVARDFAAEFCGITAAGAVHCWDVRGDGRLHMTPHAVLPGRAITSLTLARFRRCAVVTGGDALCF